MTVIDDIVLVDGWQFQIDRSVPAIVAELGKGKENPNIRLEITPTISTDYVNATLNVKIIYGGEINEIRIKGNTEEIPTAVEGVYTINKTIEENGTYTVVVKDKDGNYKIDKTKITEITEDMDIWNKADMEKFRDMVNSGRTFQGRTVRVMEDINLEGSESNQWVPIGTETIIFRGTFNGQNHAINNLYINMNTSDSSSSDLLFGLFRCNVGTIENVILKEGSIKCQAIKKVGIGGICGGNLQNGTIKYCINESVPISVKINAATNGEGGMNGGIAGINYGIIEKCGNLAKIEGITTYVTNMVNGGIVAYNNGSIKKCYNKGELIAESGRNASVSGIANNTTSENRVGTIEECYNRGNLIGNETGSNSLYMGGICAYNKGSIDNCYSTGTVTKKSNTTSSAIGISLGFQQGSNVTRCYYLKDLGYTGYGKIDSSVPSNITTVTPQKTEAELKALAPTLGESFTSDVKNEDGKWKYNDGYPILEWQTK